MRVLGITASVVGLLVAAPTFAQQPPTAAGSASASSPQAPAPPAAASSASGLLIPPDPSALSPSPPSAARPPAQSATGAQSPAEALAAWQKLYLQARERMIAGGFEEASQQFFQLAQTAPNPSYYLLAVEHWRLALQWSSRGLVLVRRADLGESSVSAKAADERTSDELAVLYTDAVLYGLGSGVWVAVLTEPKSAAGGILPALALAGGSVGLVAGLDSGRPLRYGVPQSIATGLWLGLEEGLLWTFWNQAHVERHAEWEGKTAASVIWGFATAGAIAGGVIGQTAGTTPGRASFVGSSALWSSALLGMTVAAFADWGKDTADDTVLLSAALGLNAGGLAGVLAAGSVSPSVARMRYIDLGGLAGGVLFGGLYVAGAGEDSKPGAMLGVTALGMAVGLGTAWYATAKMPQDRTERPEKAGNLSVSWSPRVAPTQGGVTMGLGGVF